MRRIAVAALAVSLGTACAGVSSTTTAAFAPGSTIAPTPSTSTVTTAGTTTTTAASTAAAGPQAASLAPAGRAAEDFVPLVEHYFAIRNWALEHPGEATEEILATVIEPGSVEMRDTLAEIQALLDDDAHYEGLTETFRVLQVIPVAETSDPIEGIYSTATTIEYGVTHLVYGDGTLEADSIRRAGWTLHFLRFPSGVWLVNTTLRNPFMRRPSSP